MVIFTCEDSLEGILCGVYDAWMSRLGHANVRLELQERGNLRMFSEYRQTAKEDWKTEKVIDTIRRKAGQEVYEQVFHASLSREEEKADRIYRFLICALHLGPAVTDMLQIPAVYELFRMNRNVTREAMHLIEFIRFSQLREGALFGVVGPENDVILLMAPHFADRLNAENWIIYDEKRNTAVVHPAGGECALVRLPDEKWRERLTESGDQEEFERLWKTFHTHIAIRERTNRACQMTHLPLRFRPYMTEFQ